MSIDICIACYKKHFLLWFGKASAPRIHKPWITNDLVGKIKERNKLLSKLIRFKDFGDLQIFQSLRSQLAKELSSQTASYFETNFFTCQNDSCKIWVKLSKIINQKQSPTH